MGRLCRRACLLLIIAICRLEGAYTYTYECKEMLCGLFNKLQIQKGSFVRTLCQWNQADKSVMCKGMHLIQVPSDLPYSVDKIYLQCNSISVLSNTSFEPYSNLHHLDLHCNDLKTIQPAAFQPLKHLEFLDLSENPDLVISNSVLFQPLEALVVLNMSGCNLGDLPNHLLDWFQYLKHLDLSGNQLSSLNVTRCKTAKLVQVFLNHNKFRDLTPETFRFACPTKLFILLDSPIRYISENAVAALTIDGLVLGMFFAPSAPMLFNLTSGIARSNISYLGFVKMELHGGIPLGVFRPLRDYPMKTILIMNSGELSLYKNVFFGLGCRDLKLNENFIREIEPEYFLGMSRLRGLQLWNNQIMQINPHNTTWKSNVQYLDLSRNMIAMLDGHQLRGLRNLKGLNLSRNSELNLLDLFSYGGFQSLVVIDVAGTALVLLGLSPGIRICYFTDRIFELSDPFQPGKTFNNTTKLQLLDFRHSQLNIGDIWDFFLNISLFRGLINLGKLRLSNNPLGNLPERVFEDNSLLAHLAMDNCEMTSLTANVFKGLQSLNHLDLNGNNLLQISTDVLQHLPVLTTLNINNNKIMFVEEGAMEYNKLLSNLSLSNNQLVAFNRSTWNTIMNHLDYIDVSGNPLACQCNYDWLHDLAKLSEMFLHQTETFCSVDSLSQLRGKPLLEFDPSKYCVPNFVLVSTLPFVALGLLIGLLLAFHNRWLIRYKLFLVKLAVIGYREMQDAREHDEFVFDINIMFTEDNEVWAREHLRATLEERLPDYDRYSFGDEDLTLGMHYLEAVHYAVENSFKTILLLSKRAVRDNWFLIKLRTAMDHVHDELIENTVVIFLEDIPEDEIPYLLRLYLSDRKPYMRWPEDVRGQEYFWNELTKVVTVNLNYNPLIPPE